MDREKGIAIGDVLRKISNCDGCGRFINVDKAEMIVLKDYNKHGQMIELYCKNCEKKRGKK